MKEFRTYSEGPGTKAVGLMAGMFEMMRDQEKKNFIVGPGYITWPTIGNENIFLLPNETGQLGEARAWLGERLYKPGFPNTEEGWMKALHDISRISWNCWQGDSLKGVTMNMDQSMSNRKVISNGNEESYIWISTPDMIREDK